MKAKTMLGLIACASACVSLSAFGNETNGWFGVKVENNAIIHPNCQTNGAAVTIVEGSKIKLEDATLAINSFSSAPTSDDIVKISAVALLTPNSTNDLYSSEALESAKAGFAVGVDDLNATNFYGYANGSWHKLTGQADPYNWDGDTTFSMILNYRDHVVSFYVGDVALTSADSLTLNATTLTAIDASGSGSITSITGAYEVAVAGYGGKKYGSIDEAVAEAGLSTDSVVTYSDSGTEESPTAENGMLRWVCKALDVATDDPNAIPSVVPSGSDTSTDAITLKLNYDPARDGAAAAAGVLQFKVGDGEPVSGDQAIQIPLTSGTGNYQIKVVY